MSATPLPPPNSCDSLIQVCRTLQSRPIYAPVRRVGGEDHRPLFQTTVQVVPLGYQTQGSGPSKTIARRSAAAAMLDIIKTRHPDPETQTNDVPHFFVDREPDPSLEMEATSSPSRPNSHIPNQSPSKPSANLPRISPLSVTQSDTRPIPPSDTAILRNPSVPDSHSLPRINRRPLSLPPKQPFTGGVVPPAANPHYPKLDHVYPSAIQPSMPIVQHVSQPATHAAFASPSAEIIFPDANQAQVLWNDVMPPPAAANLPIQTHKMPLSQPVPQHPNPNSVPASQPMQLDGGYNKHLDSGDARGDGKTDSKGCTEPERNDEADAWREEGELRETDEDNAVHEPSTSPLQSRDRTKEGEQVVENKSSEVGQMGEKRADSGKELQRSVKMSEKIVDKAGHPPTTEHVKNAEATQGRKEISEETTVRAKMRLKESADVEYVAKMSEANANGGDGGIDTKQQVKIEVDGNTKRHHVQVGDEDGALVRSPHPPRKWRSESASLRAVAGAAKRKRADGERVVLRGEVEEEELEGGDGGEGIPIRKRSRPSVEKVIRKRTAQLPCRLKLTVVAEMGIGWVREQVMGLVQRGLSVEVTLVMVGGGDAGIRLGECVKGVRKVSLGSEAAGMVLAFECGKWLERVWVERGRFLADDDAGSISLCPRMLVVCDSVGVRRVVEKAGVVDVVDKKSVGLTRFVTALLEEAKLTTGKM